MQDYSPDWFESGLPEIDGYCVTVVHDIEPDEALRRFGAGNAEISDTTWSELVDRLDQGGFDDHVAVVVFRLGPHALIVEDNGYAGVFRPDLSRDTFAVSCYRSINGDETFLVSRDGVELATFQEGQASWAEGAEPEVIRPALSEMGVEDVDAFDADEENFLDGLELLCRVAGVRPTAATMRGPARAAVLSISRCLPDDRSAAEV